MFRPLLVVVWIVIFSMACAWGQTTVRASVSSGNVQGNFASRALSISGDGRYVAFDSDASTLVPNDTNAVGDVFVHDLLTVSTTRVSVGSAGAEGDLSSDSCSISADGRYVAFRSIATNLVPGDTNGSSDTFVHDRLTGVTTRVSVDSAGVQGNADSYDPEISGDGRFIAFTSLAANLVPGDTNLTFDVFVHDRLTGVTTRVSVDSAGMQADARSNVFVAISADGRCVAFMSDATNLVPGDTNARADVFVHDRRTGNTSRVSVSSAGIQGNDDSGGLVDALAISVDGRFVSFESDATNLVSSDTNASGDVFLHDRVTGITTRVSVTPPGFQANLASGWPSISADGRRVAFHSDATNLVANDTNGVQDVFVRDRGPDATFTPTCFGDGTGAACPCANNGNPGHGCQNSAGTGGARLSGAGSASLAVDTAQLICLGELPTALSIFLQGSSFISPQSFGDGLRCAGGTLGRLYVHSASSGVLGAPVSGDLPISLRSARLGDPISLGATRIYQVYYRDPNLGFCPGGFNLTNAIAIAWGS